MSRLFSNRGSANYVMNPYQEQINRSREILIAAPYVSKTDQLVTAAHDGQPTNLFLLVAVDPRLMIHHSGPAGKRVKDERSRD